MSEAKMRGFCFWVSCLGIAGAGCGVATSATLLRAPPHGLAPRAPETIEVFSSGPPARPHVDLALIEAEQESSGSEGGTAALVAAMRAKAGELGCDALVIGNALSRSDSLTNALTGYNYDRQALIGTCVVYTNDSATAAPAIPRIVLSTP